MYGKKYKMPTNIFSGDDKNKKEFSDKIDTHSQALLSMTQRQKDLELKIDLADEKIELLDHNSISNFKKISADIKSLRTDILSLRHDINSIKEFNMRVSKQLRIMTTKDEVAKLEKYIDLWNPIEFLTREEHDKSKEEFIGILTKIIEEFLSGKTDNKLPRKEIIEEQQIKKT